MSEVGKPLSPDELLGPLNQVEQKYAPDPLYVAGHPEILHAGARVSIVGSRKANPEGLKRAGKLARLLVDRGVVVVSGLAEGIDTAAHASALDRQGHTIAVIGTPLDQTYPKSNAELQQRLMREHLVISQFPSGYPVNRKNFPMRNRTMALISDATVIVEASDTSGSLSQGWETLRLGRGLFIMKSVAESKNLQWPAKLIHYGAQVLSDENLEDFFGTLPLRTKAETHAAVPF